MLGKMGRGRRLWLRIRVGVVLLLLLLGTARRRMGGRERGRMVVRRRAMLLVPGEAGRRYYTSLHFISFTYLLCGFVLNLDHAQRTDIMANTQKAADAPFTDDEDATLKRMKDEKKSWNEIIEVLGRNKKVLQDRFKELNGGGGGGNDTKKDEKKDNGKKDGDGEGKKDKPDTKKENKKQDKKPEAAKPAYAKAGSAAGSNDQARFTMNEWMTLQEDDVFSFAELQCLSELMLRDERHRWMRLASAFYDKTGRRVHPDDIREKFGEMGGLK